MRSIKEMRENRWEDDGGAIVPLDVMASGRPMLKKRSLEPQSGVISLPPFEHKEPPDDDCGLPKHPIYANYSKYLWTSHKRSGGKQIVNYHGEPSHRSGENDG